MWNKEAIPPKKGILFVVSAPAGTGKSTLVKMLKEENPDIVQSISYTTRYIREGEEDGVDYNFISESAFKQRIAEGDLLEYAEVFGNYYGTSKNLVNSLLDQGKHVVLVIDTQGAGKLRELHLPAVFIFITPPSMNELKKRLEKRATEKGHDIQKRLNKVSDELAACEFYDYAIENDDLLQAFSILKSIVSAEEHRIRPQF